MNITEFNSTQIFNSITPECFGNYTSICLAILLFISEVLPFLKNKSDCKKNNVIDESQNEIKRENSLLNDSNGVLHTALSFYNHINKK